MIDQRQRLSEAARFHIDTIRDIEVKIRSMQEDIAGLRADLDFKERPFLLTDYPSKTKEIRDAQRADDMERDRDLRAARETLQRFESILAGWRIDRDYEERLYRISLAELRVLGTER